VAFPSFSRKKEWLEMLGKASISIR
jgi:hypothetical protein